MPKRVQDIVPPGKKSIRNVSLDRDNTELPAEEEITPKEKPRARRSTRGDIRPPTESTHPTMSVPVHEVREMDAPLVYLKDDQVLPPTEDVNGFNARRMPITPPGMGNMRRSSGGRGYWVIGTIAVIAVILVCAYVASTRYARATFTIVPKMIPVAVNGTYVAAPSPAPSGIGYDVITLNESATTTVPATDGPIVNTKAQGKVTLYNTFSSTAQRLIAGTRLTNDSGLVYRLSSSIVIPGYTKSGSNTAPGSVSATIVADMPGQQYNISGTDSISDFKVVAYKGSSRYDTIYGRLAGSLAGGYSGTKKIVSPTAIASTTALLKTKITNDLLAQIQSNLPAGYTTYPSTYSMSFGTATVGGTDHNVAAVSIQGKAYILTFKTSDLIAALVGSQTVEQFGNFAYNAPGLDALSVTFSNAKDFSPTKRSSAILKIKGSMKIIGVIPVDELKHKLAGVSLSTTQSILKPYSPVIQTGTGELVPPWAKVPTDLSRITINVQEQ